MAAAKTSSSYSVFFSAPCGAWSHDKCNAANTSYCHFTSFSSEFVYFSFLYFRLFPPASQIVFLRIRRSHSKIWMMHIKLEDVHHNNTLPKWNCEDLVIFKEEIITVTENTQPCGSSWFICQLLV